MDLKGKDAIPENVDHAMIWIDPTQNAAIAEVKESKLALTTDGMHASDNVQLQGLAEILCFGVPCVDLCCREES